MRKIGFSLGANLGDRLKTLENATLQLADFISEMQVSSVYESKAWGNPNQPDFLNLVIVGDVTITADEILAKILAIEKLLGRTRGVKWDARIVDIDILFIENEHIATDVLTVPHPYLHERLFVLMPLFEIFPQWRHPILGKTISEFISHFPVESQNGLRTFATRAFKKCINLSP